MKLKVSANLHHLRCVTPTDPSGEDEPYLWTFFVRADGVTIRQSTVNPTRLSANIQVHGGPGRPGNLLVDGIESGGLIRIPAAVGAFDSELRPIVLNLPQGGQTYRFYIPGFFFMVAQLIDEESVPRDAMEGANLDVKNLLKNRLDDFINNLDLTPMILQAIADGGIDGAVQSFQNTFTDFIGDSGRGLIKELNDAAEQSATLAVLSSWNPFVHLFSALDKDEPIGGMRMMVREDEIITNNLTQDATQNIRQSSSPLGGAWYIIYGGTSADLSFTQADALMPVQAMPPTRGDGGEYVFREGKLCIAAGSRVTWTRMLHQQRYDVSIPYPFARFEYRLDGKLVEGNSGTLTLSKEVAIPEFDPSTYKFMRYRHETRDVQVTFERVRLPTEPQVEHIIFCNNPADGLYLVELKIEAALNDGRRLFAGQHVINFEGQSIQIPEDFLKGVEGCLEPLTSNRFSKSVKVGPKELWGPYGRQERFEQISQVLETLATLRGQESALTQSTLNALAAKMNIVR